MIQVGIVGCGKIADAHVEEIQKLGNAHLVGVCDLEPIMAEQLATRYGVPKWYCNFDQMLAEQNLDVVHITTPPGSHLSLVRKAVAAGSHVFVEKPAATDAEHVHALIETVEQAGRKLAVNYWYNFDPPGWRLREIVENGLLGDPVHVESYLGYNLDGVFGQALLSDPEHWVHKLPGKLFQNNLDHVLNKIIPFLPDVPPEVTTVSFRRRDARKDDSTDDMHDELRAIIRAGTVTAYATFSSHARPAAHLLRVYGTKKTVQVDYNLRMVTFLEELTPPSALGRLIPPFRQVRQDLRQALANVGLFRHAQFHYFDGMNRLISMFYQSIENDSPVPIPYSTILRVADMMDRVIAGAYPAVLV
jgi:predicted dehydrogenase